jgi:hypothetical protein
LFFHERQRTGGIVSVDITPADRGPSGGGGGGGDDNVNMPKTL